MSRRRHFQDAATAWQQQQGLAALQAAMAQLPRSGHSLQLRLLSGLQPILLRLQVAAAAPGAKTPGWRGGGCAAVGAALSRGAAAAAGVTGTAASLSAGAARAGAAGSAAGAATERDRDEREEGGEG